MIEKRTEGMFVWIFQWVGEIRAMKKKIFFLTWTFTFLHWFVRLMYEWRVNPLVVRLMKDVYFYDFYKNRICESVSKRMNPSTRTKIILFLTFFCHVLVCKHYISYLFKFLQKKYRHHEHVLLNEKRTVCTLKIRNYFKYVST